jgi:acetyl-CoA C-acetyltransferase
MGNVVRKQVQDSSKGKQHLRWFTNTVACTTINKVCASGMKAVMMGAQAIQAEMQKLLSLAEWKT